MHSGKCSSKETLPQFSSTRLYHITHNTVRAQSLRMVEGFLNDRRDVNKMCLWWGNYIMSDLITHVCSCAYSDERLCMIRHKTSETLLSLAHQSEDIP